MSKTVATFIALAAGTMLAAPAQALSALPPVSGGDLGCAVRLMVYANGATETAADPKKSQADRDAAKQEADKANSDFDFFVGRISRDPESKARSEQTLQIFSAFMDESADQMAKEVTACQDWSRAKRSATLESLKTK